VAERAGDSGSRAEQVRAIIAGVARMDRARGGVLVAPDGFVIDAQLRPDIAVEPLAAVAAALGRELELGADRLSRGMAGTAFFSAQDGGLFLGGSPVGFLAVVAEPDADVQQMRNAVKQALDALQQIWRAGDHTGDRL
jgi:predicted regulator of Ras-like GTPase activity (Roadblock/LC7/MglB family)